MGFEWPEISLPDSSGYGRHTSNGGSTSRSWSTSSREKRGDLATKGDKEAACYVGHGALQHSQLDAVWAACGCPWQQFIVMNDSKAFIWA